MTNTILDDAEARIAPAAARAQATQREIVDAMREEIGRAHYDQAKVELPKLELLLSREIRPYLTRLTKIAQRATVPLPANIVAYVRELEDACATAPDWIRVGIAEWNGLEPPYAKDSQEIDGTRRAEEIGSVRMKLRNWSGREDRLQNLMAYINNYIQESGWPASAPRST